MREILARLIGRGGSRGDLDLVTGFLDRGGGNAGVVVLDTLGVWRFHSQLAPPVFGDGGKAAV